MLLTKPARSTPRVGIFELSIATVAARPSKNIFATVPTAVQNFKKKPPPFMRWPELLLGYRRKRRLEAHQHSEGSKFSAISSQHFSSFTQSKRSSSATTIHRQFSSIVFAPFLGSAEGFATSVSNINLIQADARAAPFIFGHLAKAAICCNREDGDERLEIKGQTTEDRGRKTDDSKYRKIPKSFSSMPIRFAPQ